MTLNLVLPDVIFCAACVKKIIKGNSLIIIWMWYYSHVHLFQNDTFVTGVTQAQQQQH